MAELKITECELFGVKIIEPTYFEDFRGYYSETYSSRTMAQYGINIDFVQEGHSYTKSKSTIRGIHFQNTPKAQTKLVRCIRGKIMDFAVDLRSNSPTFCKWINVELSAENKKQLLIPKGFGHAFITLNNDCEVQYKVDEFYFPEYDRSIIWNDPEIAINWGISKPILSDKDKIAPTLAMCDVNFTY